MGGGVSPGNVVPGRALTPALSQGERGWYGTGVTFSMYQLERRQPVENAARFSTLRESRLSRPWRSADAAAPRGDEALVGAAHGRDEDAPKPPSPDPTTPLEQAAVGWKTAQPFPRMLRLAYPGPNHCVRACSTNPTRPPTRVPLMRMNCRSLPTLCSSCWTSSSVSQAATRSAI